MLLPALMKARKHALMVQCASNLRQVGITCLNYAVNHKEFPLYHDNVIYQHGISGWNYLYPSLVERKYLAGDYTILGKQNSKANFCTMVTNSSEPYPWRPNHDLYNYGEYLYCGPGVIPNGYFADFYESNPPDAPFNQYGLWCDWIPTRYKDKALKPLAADSWYIWGNWAGYAHPHFPRGRMWLTGGPRGPERGIRNWLFNDGHVVSYRY